MKNIFQKLCEVITRHRFSKCHSWSVGINPVEYHHKCKVCGYHFWNYDKNHGKRRKKR